jgi:hypothetical protein
VYLFLWFGAMTSNFQPPQRLALCIFRVSLLKIGHAPILRVILPIVWAVWGIMLLLEYLKGETS